MAKELLNTNSPLVKRSVFSVRFYVKGYTAKMVFFSLSSFDEILIVLCFQDANVKLIKELQFEIQTLKTRLKVGRHQTHAMIK